MSDRQKIGCTACGGYESHAPGCKNDSLPWRHPVSRDTPRGGSLENICPECRGHFRKGDPGVCRCPTVDTPRPEEDDADLVCVCGYPKRYHNEDGTAHHMGSEEPCYFTPEKKPAPTAPRERETPKCPCVDPECILCHPGQYLSPAPVPPVAEAREAYEWAISHLCSVRSYGTPSEAATAEGLVNTRWHSLCAAVRAERDREHRALYTVAMECRKALGDVSLLLDAKKEFEACRLIAQTLERFPLPTPTPEMSK